MCARRQCESSLITQSAFKDRSIWENHVHSIQYLRTSANQRLFSWNYDTHFVIFQLRLLLLRSRCSRCHKPRPALAFELDQHRVDSGGLWTSYYNFAGHGVQVRVRDIAVWIVEDEVCLHGGDVTGSWRLATFVSELLAPIGVALRTLWQYTMSSIARNRVIGRCEGSKMRRCDRGSWSLLGKKT